jgi:hypothetical protein
MGKISISTRRFLARPDFVLLEAIGFVSPKPLTVKRSEPIPCAAKLLATRWARIVESV